MPEVQPKLVDGVARCTSRNCPSWVPRYCKTVGEFENGKCSQDPNGNVVVDGETICVPARIAELEKENTQLRAQVAELKEYRDRVRAKGLARVKRYRSRKRGS